MGLFYIACLTVAWVGAETQDLKSRVDAHAAPLIEDGVAVGFVVGVVQRDQTEIFFYGETERGSGKLPAADTVYEIGSITKVFTGALLADLVQRQMVRLEDPIQQHVPESVTVPVKEDEPITLRQLATHTSGLPRLPDNLDPSDPRNPYADCSEERMFTFLKSHQLRRKPGEFEYSNYGMGLLGTLLARRAGCTYEELLVERICEPLGMHDTRITLNDSLRSRLAAPYNANLDLANNWDLNAVAGAGGIRSTCADMLRFIRANLADDETPVTTALARSRDKQQDIPNGLAICLGWHIARDGSTRWHNGMTGGYHSWLAVNSGLGIGVVVLANTATQEITKFGERVTQLAAGADVPVPPRPTKVVVDEATLKNYVGSYPLAASPLFVLTVTAEEGKLMVQATGQEKLPVFPQSPTEFVYRVVDARITFVIGSDGKPTKLILHQNGLDLDAPRLQ